MKHLNFFSAILAGVLLAACSSDKDETLNPGGDPCSDVPVSFSNNVAPIIANSCAANSACHGDGSVNGPGPLLNYTHVKNAAAQIQSAVVSGRMPKQGTLTATQKNIINCWVEKGALNN